MVAPEFERAISIPVFFTIGRNIHGVVHLLVPSQPAKKNPTSGELMFENRITPFHTFYIETLLK